MAAGQSLHVVEEEHFIHFNQSNFIYIAHFIPGGNTMHFTKGRRGGGYEYFDISFPREAKKLFTHFTLPT